jgi:hypothetical protein
LESLLGQALRLDDEPSLVRAVKRVKRTMEQDERFRERYISLVISLGASLSMGIGWWIQHMKITVSSGLCVIGLVRIIQSRLRWTMISQGVVITLLGVVLQTRILPAIHLVLQHVGIILLVVITTHDITSLILLKLQVRNKRKQEEFARQEKMRGIFYTPVKSAGRSIGFRAETQNVERGHTKSRSMFL